MNRLMDYLSKPGELVVSMRMYPGTGQPDGMSNAHNLAASPFGPGQWKTERLDIFFVKKNKL